MGVRTMAPAWRVRLFAFVSVSGSQFAVGVGVEVEVEVEAWSGLVDLLEAREVLRTPCS